MRAEQVNMAGRILTTARDIAAWRSDVGGNAASLAAVAGTFHMFQPGNVAAVTVAREKCGRLCVALESDDEVAAKACGRPTIPLAVRAEMVSHLRGIAAVIACSRGGERAAMGALRPFTAVVCAGHREGPAGAAAAGLADRSVPVPLLPGCSTGEILAAVRAGRTPIPLPPDFAAPSAAERTAGSRGRLVTVNGCFDVLHMGHVRFLAAARAMGDELAVLINDDASVRRYKGPSRPVFPAAFRACALLALEPVGRVQTFAEDDPLRLLAELRPDVHVKGGTYEADRTERERRLVEGWGGRLAFCPMVEGYSTTGYLESVTRP